MVTPSDLEVAPRNCAAAGNHFTEHALAPALLDAGLGGGGEVSGGIVGTVRCLGLIWLDHA